MTDEEQKKWKWVKPTCLTLGWIQQILGWLIKVPLLILWIVFYIPTQMLEFINDFLTQWVVDKPFNLLGRKLDFFELVKKARKEQNNEPS